MASPLSFHHASLGAHPTSRRSPPKLITGRWRPTHNLKPASPYRVFAVMAKPRPGIAEGPPRVPATEKTVYRDSWLDLLAINHLSRVVQAVTGMRNEKKGYESLIEAAGFAAANFGAKEQHEMVVEALKNAVPEAILRVVRIIAPPSSFSRQFFAVVTTKFFPWLVGPCEVRESEFQGRTEKNVVYIPKCRFLEGTNCVGMCTNLCKIPSQKFIQDSLGMPVYMAPNFEDMSCEMFFGQQPPEDDPALKQPCYKKSCIAKQMYDINCSI